MGGASAFAASSDLNFRKQIAADEEECGGDQNQDRVVGGQSEMRHTYENCTKTVDTISKRIETR